MELGLFMVVVGKLELGLVVEQDDCFDLAEANAVVQLAEPDTPACLSLSELAERWGVVLDRNYAEGTITVENGQHLPAVQDALRRQSWARLGHRRDPTSVENRRADVLSRPEITLQGTVDGTRNIGTQTFGIRTAVGPGTMSYRITDTTDRGVTRVRTSWDSVGPSHRFKVGDATIQANHLTDYEQGRGVELELGKRGRRAGLWTRDLAGERPGPEWSVELYLNGRLLDYLPAGDPDWAFANIPQPGEITIRYWGPTGEEETETYGSSGRGTLPPGRGAVQLGAVQADEPVLSTGEATSNGPDRGDVAVRGEVQYGLAPGLTLTGSYRHLPQGQRITGVGLSTDHGSAEMVLDDQRRVAIVGDVRLGPISIEHEHRAEGFNSNRRRGLEDRTEAHLHQRVGPVTFRPSITREAWHSGRETYDLELDASVYSGRTSFRLDTNIRHSDVAGWVAPTFRPSLRWRGDTTEIVGSASLPSGDLTLTQLSGALRHHLTDNETASLAASVSPAGDRWSSVPSVSSKSAGGWRTSLAAPIDSTGTVGITLSFSTTIGFDGAWEPRVDPKGAKAFVGVLVFEDLDGDGTRDRGERGIAGVPVRSIGSTDNDGWAKAWLTPGREIIVDLGVDELDDPRHNGTGAMAFTVQPGAWTRIEYPVRFTPL